MRRRPPVAVARRTALIAGAAALGAIALPASPRAQTDPRLTERSTGNPSAAVRVQEFFSLTCGHCAAFHRDTWPRVKRDLVETGTIQMVWRDFPLDRTGLLAAVVARSLPADRYEGFIGTLLSNQDRWAFRPDPAAELARMAALAGMTRQQFDAVAGDETLARAILNGRLDAEREFRIQATPSFAFQSGGRSRMQSGNVGFDQFLQIVDEVRRG